MDKFTGARAANSCPHVHFPPRQKPVSAPPVSHRAAAAILRFMGSLSVPRYRIALLGADTTTLAIARAILTSDHFGLFGACELENNSNAPDSASIRALLGHGRRVDAWETLLDQESVDAVVVARDDDQDRRAEQLRKLIQAGVPLLVSHPVVDSMLVYYELDMIRRETGCVVVPYLSERHHPALRELADTVRRRADSPIGKVEQVTIERCIAQPTKTNVVSQFARDVDLIRGLVGDMTRLGAMAGKSGDSAYGSLGVQMSGPEGTVARWSVVPMQAAQGARITLVGSSGKALLDIRPEHEPWSMELTSQGQTQTRRYDEWDAASAALDALAGAIRGEPSSPDWIDAARSVELAETIERSLQKSRTIELYYEDHTEEGTFKGTMTSVGCGLLLLAMFLLGIVAIADQLGLPYVRSWPYALLGVFGIFLVLQLLKLTARQQEPEPHDRIPSESAPRSRS
jgi:predicted dehydrogenase